MVETGWYVVDSPYGDIRRGTPVGRRADGTYAPVSSLWPTEAERGESWSEQNTSTSVENLRAFADMARVRYGRPDRFGIISRQQADYIDRMSEGMQDRLPSLSRRPSWQPCTNLVQDNPSVVFYPGTSDCASIPCDKFDRWWNGDE